MSFVGLILMKFCEILNGDYIALQFVKNRKNFFKQYYNLKRFIWISKTCQFKQINKFNLERFSPPQAKH